MNAIAAVVVHDDKSIELREIQTGLTNGDLVEARTNFQAGEKIVTCLSIEPLLEVNCCGNSCLSTAIKPQRPIMRSL
jgi:hypothetical protein